MKYTGYGGSVVSFSASHVSTGGFINQAGVVSVNHMDGVMDGSHGTFVCSQSASTQV